MSRRLGPCRAVTPLLPRPPPSLLHLPLLWRLRSLRQIGRCKRLGAPADARCLSRTCGRGHVLPVSGERRVGGHGLCLVSVKVSAVSLEPCYHLCRSIQSLRIDPVVKTFTKGLFPSYCEDICALLVSFRNLSKIASSHVTTFSQSESVSFHYQTGKKKRTNRLLWQNAHLWRG